MREFIVVAITADGGPREERIDATEWRIDPTGALVLLKRAQVAMVYSRSAWLRFTEV